MAALATPNVSEEIDANLIAAVVRCFYGLVRRDAVLGPIFNPRISDWPAHEEKIARFWSSVLLMTGEYHGSPMRVHLDLPDLTRGHFDRWLALFAFAVALVCTPKQGAAFQSKAQRIADAFQFVRAKQQSDNQLLPTG